MNTLPFDQTISGESFYLFDVILDFDGADQAIDVFSNTNIIYAVGITIFKWSD